jgi:hypothetical protein
LRVKARVERINGERVRFQRDAVVPRDRQHVLYDFAVDCCEVFYRSLSTSERATKDATAIVGTSMNVCMRGGGPSRAV